MTPTTWTPDKVERMFIMAENGSSMREIAEALGAGFTRNSVIGKYARERIRRGIPIPPSSFRGKHHSILRRPSIRQPSRSTGVGFILPPIDIPEPSREGACGILELKGCKWPIDMNFDVIGAHVFCNAPAEHGSYCAYHHRRNVQKPVPRSEVKRFKIPTALLRTGTA